MAPAAVAVLSLLVLGAPARPPAQGTKLEVGQRLFAQGDVEGALKALDGAAAESTDAPTLEKVHLLRAQCFAARQDFARAEDAFVLALDANPEATLDPARVDPTLVKLLDATRARLTGTVVVASTPPGARVTLDGREVGVTPLTLTPSTGRHVLSVRFGDDAPQVLDVQVRPRREQRVEWVRVEGGASGPADWFTPRPIRPYGDLRGLFEPATTGTITGGIELGGGVEFSYFRVGLSARLFPRFAVTPRFQFALPVMEQFAVLLELGVPVSFLRDGVGIGLAGGGGAEYYPLKWVGLYALIGGQHHLLWPGRIDNTAFLAVGGVRLRMP
jgi:hypothetical protein